MPDPNKLAVLEKAGYRIRSCCGLCVRGGFKPLTDWGTCALYQYEHGKHTGAPRHVSIHKAGFCEKSEIDPVKQADLGRSGFERFMEQGQ